MTTWNAWAATQLAALKEVDRLRKLVVFDGCGPQGIVDGKPVVSFASNDYLGLASHPKVRLAAHEAIDRFGTGSMASRLIVGTRSLHSELESTLAQWKSAERALVFSSGYAANIGVMSTVAQPDVTVFSDALNHASIIDGCRLAKARTVIYKHCDLDHLEWLLRQTPGKKIVVTETVFSMDGDRTPLARLAGLCVRFNALLVLDEAHDVPESHLLRERGLEVLHVGTLSKTMGSLGGFVAGSATMIDLLVNRARTFIFTTALSPADTAAALAGVQIYMGPEGDALRRRLRQRIDAVQLDHPSAIVPIILGTDAAAMNASAQLLAQGLYVPAIRPPTVPVDTARLRVALSAAHTDGMVQRLKAALDQLTPAPHGANLASV
jgi:8-amino-7-oxononanoate synthase